MSKKEKVIRVIDGDTFITSSRKNPVRVAGYDAPEKGAKGAAQATKKLSSIIKGEEVTITTKARDSYGRAVANVKVGQKSVNKIMKDFVSKKTSKRK